jgi:hypothetical protein
MTALILALLTQVPNPMNLNGTNITSVYCDGGVACLKQGSRLTIIGTPSSGGGSGGKVAEAYMADASIFATQLAADPTACPGGQFVTDLAANGALTCATPAGSGGKVSEAYMADAAITAQQAGFAYAADASVFAVVSGTAYSADAAYQTQFATTANVAFSADASYFSSVATVATSAYAADASISAMYLTLTCSAGQFVTCSGSACSCSTPSGGGGGGSANYSSGTATFSGKSDTTTTVTAAWATSGSSIICSAQAEESSVEAMQSVVTTKATGSFVVRSYVLQGTHTGALPFTCTGL